MRPDPAVGAMKAVAVVMVVAIVALIVHLANRPDIQCPPQDHPVQAQVQVHGHDQAEWICGASLTVGVKAKP